MYMIEPVKPADLNSFFNLDQIANKNSYIEVVDDIPVYRDAMPFFKRISLCCCRWKSECVRFNTVRHAVQNFYNTKIKPNTEGLNGEQKFKIKATLEALNTRWSDKDPSDSWKNFYTEAMRDVDRISYPKPPGGFVVPDSSLEPEEKPQANEENSNVIRDNGVAGLGDNNNDAEQKIKEEEKPPERNNGSERNGQFSRVNDGDLERKVRAAKAPDSRDNFEKEDDLVGAAVAPGGPGSDEGLIGKTIEGEEYHKFNSSEMNYSVDSLAVQKLDGVKSTGKYVKILKILSSGPIVFFDGKNIVTKSYLDILCIFPPRLIKMQSAEEIEYLKQQKPVIKRDASDRNRNRNDYGQGHHESDVKIKKSNEIDKKEFAENNKAKLLKRINARKFENIKSLREKILKAANKKLKLKEVDKKEAGSKVGKLSKSSAIKIGDILSVDEFEKFNPTKTAPYQLKKDSFAVVLRSTGEYQYVKITKRENQTIHYDLGDGGVWNKSADALLPIGNKLELPSQ